MEGSPGNAGNVLVLGTDQPVNWSAFFEIRVRLSAELAITPRSRFLARSKMKAFHKCVPVGATYPTRQGAVWASGENPQLLQIQHLPYRR